MPEQQITTSADPATFDFDAWMSGSVRPGAVVTLHPGHDAIEAEMAALAEELKDLERAAEIAERTTADDRGPGDLSPEAVTAKIADADRRYRDALKRYEALRQDFHVRQLLRDEIATARAAGIAAGATEDDLPVWLLAAAITSPTVTAAQLIALRDRDRHGEDLYSQLMQAAGGLLVVTPPSSPPSSSAPS